LSVEQNIVNRVDAGQSDDGMLRQANRFISFG
jgi:hypothetical protein